MNRFYSKIFHVCLISLSLVGINVNEGLAQVEKKLKTADYSRRRNTQLVSFYLDSARLLTNQAPLRAIDNLNKAIELSIGNNDKANEALAYWIFGNIEQNLDQHDLAIENYKKCINTLSSGDDDMKSFSMNKSSKAILGPNQQLFNAYRSMAVSLLESNKLAEAYTAISTCFRNQFEDIVISDRMDAKRIQASILLKQGKPNESLDILTSTLEEEKSQPYSSGETKTLIAIATVYQQTKRESKAIDYYLQAKTAAEKIKNSELLISINNSLAEIFRQQKNTTKELEVRNNTIALNNSTVPKSSMSVPVPNTDKLTEIKSKSNDSTDNVKKERLSKEVSTLDKQIQPGLNPLHFSSTATDVAQQPLFNKSNDLEYTANTYKLRAEAFLKQGDNQQALAALQTFIEIQDSIKVIRKNELDQAIKISTALGKNQQRVDLLEKERNLSDRSIEVLRHDQKLKEDELYTRNIIIGTLLFLIIFMLAGSYSILKSFREKRKANQLLAVKSLRGQMNPHFIFNALNSVNQYISQNDERAANKYLSDFSKLMRAVMETSKHDLISLSEELDILKLYLQLEHSRFKDKFDYTFHMDESIDASEFDLPPMIIQPFIENAVWHGLRYVDEKGVLIIDIKKLNDDLLITVSDNGIGRKKSQELKTKNQKLQNSTGMQNIENRITIMNELFKTNIKVNIGDAYTGIKNAGTRVEIFIPKKINDHA
jgi:tetratricopeptide (TPR) repeat protein